MLNFISPFIGQNHFMREKIVRGIKIKDSVLINGYQMYHNFLRPHMGLNGQTPAQACGINIEGDNKWMTLIQNASRREA